MKLSNFNLRSISAQENVDNTTKLGGREALSSRLFRECLPKK